MYFQLFDKSCFRKKLVYKKANFENYFYRQQSYNKQALQTFSHRPFNTG